MEMHIFPSQLQKRWRHFRALRSGRLSATSLHASALLAKPRKDHPFSQLRRDQLSNHLRSSAAKPRSWASAWHSGFKAHCIVQRVMPCFSEHWSKF